MKLSVGVEIAASPDDVWRVLEPIEHHVEWMSDAESITFTGPTTRGVVRCSWQSASDRPTKTSSICATPPQRHTPNTGCLLA